jgi:hypothetical protein
MDKKTAESLLKQIKQEKKANESKLTGVPGVIADPTSLLKKLVPGSSSTPNSPYASLASDLRAAANQKMQQKSMSNVIRATLLAGGAGAALRGVSGLQHMFSNSAKPVASRTVDMPVMYPAPTEDEGEEKTADNSKATAPWGLDWYIPSMVLGAPLAAYGGWKGVDSLLDKQRHKKTDAELETAKADYQRALLGAYKPNKTAADGDEDPEDILGNIFDQHYKQAEEEGFISGLLNRHAPNLTGMTKGLGAMYAIPAAVGGYAMVNSVMQKRSRRALLQKAMRERARRQAQMQPAELYAIPTPKEDPETESR